MIILHNNQEQVSQLLFRLGGDYYEDFNAIMGISTLGLLEEYQGLYMD